MAGLFILGLSMGILWPYHASSGEGGIRPPAVAGKFYPDDPEKLGRAIDLYLMDAKPATGLKPIALVAPHAGFTFSGQIAADAYKQAQNHDYDLVVILGTNHTAPGFNGVSLFAGEGYRTPLGVAAVEQALTQSLILMDDDFTSKPEIHANEHSIEVQIPFIQRIFPGRPIIAAIVGRPDPDLCRRFGAALASVIRDRNALIIASTDLSHYPSYDDAIAVDHATLKSMISLDPAAVRISILEQKQKNYPNLSTCACGEGPILASIFAAVELGATGATIISYANSGDTSLGDPSRVVGYGAASIHKGVSNASALDDPPPLELNPALSAEDKKWLLAFARDTVHRYLTTGTTPLARPENPMLHRRRGAFVTLKTQHQLRGCIGHMAEDSPLCQVIGAMALQAAFNDRRFDPVRADELSGIEFEVSVLTPFQPINGPESIVIGRDGVVIRKDQHSAVFLPQVALEQGWNRDEMLTQLCRKAGLYGECWKENAELFTFQADVFHEQDYR